MSNILVRHSEPTDAEDVWKIYQQPRVIRGTLQLPCPSLERWKERLADRQEGFFSLVADAEGEVIGHLGLEVFPHWRRRHGGRLGMAVHDHWQGRGVGSSLMKAALDLADGWLGLTRLELDVYPDNESAVALYQKFGFETEGRQRDAVFREGKLIDVLLMARLRAATA